MDVQMFYVPYPDVLDGNVVRGSLSVQIACKDTQEALRTAEFLVNELAGVKHRLEQLKTA